MYTRTQVAVNHAIRRLLPVWPIDNPKRMIHIMGLCLLTTVNTLLRTVFCQHNRFKSASQHTLIMPLSSVKNEHFQQVSTHQNGVNTSCSIYTLRNISNFLSVEVVCCSSEIHFHVHDIIIEFRPLTLTGRKYFCINDRDNWVFLI